LEFLLFVHLIQPQLASRVKVSQVCQSEGYVLSPGWSLSSKSHVVAVIGFEGGHADAGVVVVVIGKFCSVEKVCPIILLVIAKYSEVCANPLVVVLYLSLCLWMVWC
jgi:hypothetical protein